MPRARLLVLEHKLKYMAFSKMIEKFREEKLDDMDIDLQDEERRQRNKWEADLSNYRVLSMNQKQSSLLQACHESRQEALSIYRVRLDTKHANNAFRMDPDLDSILVAGSYLANTSVPFEIGAIWSDVVLRTVRHLIFETRRLVVILATDPGNPLRNFLNLEDVVIIAHTSQCGFVTQHLSRRAATFQVPEPMVVPTLVAYAEPISELQRRFSSFLNTTPTWKVPAVTGKTMMLHSKVGIKHCCAMTRRDYRDM